MASRHVASKDASVMRLPSLRAPLDLLFLFCCIVLTAFVLVPEIWGHGKTKDYPLWYWAGQQVLHGGDLYPSESGTFYFIYPPLSAVLLAIPSWFGKIPLYLCLCIINMIAWWVTLLYCHAMAGSDRTPGWLIFALPGVVTITFVFDMFDLGQPNLVLLALMLHGFWTMQHARPWTAGCMFALATALKVFPLAVFPYLIWRRQWTAVASMLVFLGVFLFVFPAPVRGFQHNFAELKTWYQGMVASSSEKGFGQRDQQNWSWVNQSLIAMTHRLTRPVNYNQDDPTKPVRTMNLVDISFKAANYLVVVISLVIGLGYVAVLPKSWQRTERSDAEELGILFCLMTIASPLARQYYFVWLIFPITVMMHRAAYDPRLKVRIWSWLTLAVMGLLMCLSFGVFPRDLQAFGNNFAATVVLAGGLVWHLMHPPKERTASPEPRTELQPAP
jgi:hypothetical protein